MLIQDGKIRKIHAISEAKAQEIKNFFQGAIRCHDKVAVGEWFSLRDLMGGENFDWNGTPLQELFEVYRGRSDALKMTAKSAVYHLDFENSSFKKSVPFNPLFTSRLIPGNLSWTI